MASAGIFEKGPTTKNSERKLVKITRSGAVHFDSNGTWGPANIIQDDGRGGQCLNGWRLEVAHSNRDRLVWTSTEDAVWRGSSRRAGEQTIWVRTQSQRTLVLLSTDPTYCPLIPACETALQATIALFVQREDAAHVRILVLGDAKEGDAHILRSANGMGKGILPMVKNIVQGLGRATTVRGYRFFRRMHLQRDDITERAIEHLMHPAIVICWGGNTFELSNGLQNVPRLRETLQSRVRQGKVMYISNSAATINAGRSLAHSRDPQTPKEDGSPPSLEGLGLYDGDLNPHNQPRRGVAISDGHAFFVLGSKEAHDCVPASWRV